MYKKLFCGLILVFLFAFTFTIAYSYTPREYADPGDCCKVRIWWTGEYVWGVWIDVDGELECMCDEINNPNSCLISCPGMKA